jgi:hypothetical protein
VAPFVDVRGVTNLTDQLIVGEESHEDDTTIRVSCVCSEGNVSGSSERLTRSWFDEHDDRQCIVARVADIPMAVHVGVALVWVRDRRAIVSIRGYPVVVWIVAMLVVSVKWCKSSDASSERVITRPPDPSSACPSIHRVL